LGSYTNGKHGKPKSSIFSYHCLQLLNQEYNHCFGRIVMSLLQFFAIILPSYCNYTLIRHHAKLRIISLMATANLSFLAILLVIVAFPIGASIHRYSMNFLNSFKRRSVCAIAVKLEVKACRSLRIQVGSFLFLRQFTVLKVISLIIYWTMSSLLLF